MTVGQVMGFSLFQALSPEQTNLGDRLSKMLP